MPMIVWLGALAVAVAAPVLWWALAPDRTLSPSLVRKNLGLSPPDLRQHRLDRSPAERLVLPVLDRVALACRSLLPVERAEAAERRLAAAGLTGRWTGTQLLAAQVLVAGLVAVAGAVRLVVLPSTAGVALVAVGVLVAYLGPDLVVRRLADRRQARITVELPDVLDQLTISVEAGLGFEAALQRVVRHTPGPLAEELGRMLQDVQVGIRRSVALERLLQRTDAPDFRHVVVSLVQSERLGVPLARTLRNQAREMRLKRRMRAEEAANKIGVKLMFPVVFCLFPSLFIVILGPAAIRIAETFIG
jgi:tight adherence protein C